MVAFHVFEHHHGACKHEKERNQIGEGAPVLADRKSDCRHCQRGADDQLAMPTKPAA